MVPRMLILAVRWPGHRRNRSPGWQEGPFNSTWRPSSRRADVSSEPPNQGQLHDLLGRAVYLPRSEGQFYGKTKPGRCYATQREASEDGCRRSER